MLSSSPAVFSATKATNRKAIQAGGLAQRVTGAAITTHTSRGACFSGPGTMGMEQLDVIEGEGGDASRVIIGHCDHNPQGDHHLELARRGAYVQVDHVGSQIFSSDQRRAEAVVHLFEHGLRIGCRPQEDLPRVKDFRANGGQGRSFLFREFVPLLRTYGLGDGEIRQLIVGNPRRVYGRSGPRRRDGRFLVFKIAIIDGEASSKSIHRTSCRPPLATPI